MNHNVKWAISIFIAWAITLILTLWSEGVFAEEDYFYVRVGFGINEANCGCWEDQDSIGGRFMFGNRHHWGGNWYGDANLLHHSQPFIGWPVNDDDETSSYHLYYDLEYRF